jgi:hypothetical protein
LYNGFSPSSSDSFQVVNASNLSGQFSAVQSDFGTFDAVYESNRVLLTNFVPNPMAPAASIGALNDHANSVLGGSTEVGGIDAAFQNQEVGILSADFHQVDEGDLEDFYSTADPAFDDLDFSMPGSADYQFWDLDFAGDEIGPDGLDLVVAYNDAGMTLDDELSLRLFHFDGNAWWRLDGTVDATANTITVTTPGLSPFVLAPVGDGTFYGDYDGNGTVGVEDIDTWRENFGSGNLVADGTGNGIVDAADYVLWRKNLGTMFGSGDSPAVPEPPSLLLLTLAISILFSAVSRLAGR